MALSRLLLLCVVASKVWDAETKPIEFVCNKSARRALNIVAEMESALSDCNGSANLSTPVQLPCTELHVASWENKSHQDKRGDIVASLRLLLEGVNVVKAQCQPGCAASLLQRLKNNINNYLLILTHLQLSVRSGHGANDESSTVLCSSKHPQSEHNPVELQQVDLRQTGAVHG
ncbi:thrombopoietin isoform X2 [Anoplopoma fimbria]|uniref:thrombopoietin isoform X2 n=1 Tax=Anoplopoma fimbria TaxID=229290 RepID=UPI0023EBE56E|nr:thrombopoietin isoform X2 [Anoplopoma fimbria]